MALFSKSKKGFTLIELVVTVAIIGILSSIVLVSMTSSRAKGRDGRRLSDINQIKSGLDLYFSSGTGYPDLSTWNSGNLSCASVDYLFIPKDPLGTDYQYETSGESFASPTCGGATVWSDYSLQFKTEQKSDLGEAGDYCLLPSGITGGSCP